MRRKNSATFQESNQQGLTHDSYDPKEKTPHGNDGGSISSSADSNLRHQNGVRNQRDNFISAFERQNGNATTIKRIEYPANKKSRTSRRQGILVDSFSKVFAALACIALFGLHRFIMPPQIGSFRNRFLELPVNHEIIKSIGHLQQSVTRRTTETSFPVLLDGIFDLPRLLDDAFPRDDTEDQNQSVFSYPGGVLDNYTFISKGLTYPNDLDDEIASQADEQDYGEVDVKFLTEEGQTRRIYRQIWEGEGKARKIGQVRDDDVEVYWAFDDDWLRNPYVLYDDENIQDIHRCRRANWYRKMFPTGNLLHELDFARNTPKFVGEGAYREVFLAEHNVLGKREVFVLKELHYERGMHYDDYEYIRMDALVTERMSSNDNIVNMFAYTGYSLITEAFINGDIEEDLIGEFERDENFDPFSGPDVAVLNNFTASVKLKLALKMVEPVAALHNYKDGVIIHNDIQMSQYLWTDDTKTSVKLNDFNRADIMFWDDEYEQYCKYINGHGPGDWRSPEEYRNDPLNDKIDVWSLGNNMYSLLTGYFPWHNVESTSKIKQLVMDGELPKIDPRLYDRSFAERKLIDVIERALVTDVDERADINELLEMLLDAVAEDERRAVLNITYLEPHHTEEEDQEEDSLSPDEEEHSDKGDGPIRHSDSSEEEDGEEEEEDHVQETTPEQSDSDVDDIIETHAENPEQISYDSNEGGAKSEARVSVQLD